MRGNGLNGGERFREGRVWVLVCQCVCVSVVGPQASDARSRARFQSVTADEKSESAARYQLTAVTCWTRMAACGVRKSYTTTPRQQYPRRFPAAPRAPLRRQRRAECRGVGADFRAAARAASRREQSRGLTECASGGRASRCQRHPRVLGGVMRAVDCALMRDPQWG